MRKLIVLLAIFLAGIGCNKDNNSGGGIVIKGRIPGSSQKGSGSKSAESLPLSEARKVFIVNIYNGGLNSKFIDITDGSFTATSEIGEATALVFLDANNKYIGTLSSRGLNLLPLNNLVDGENTAIDLADLSLSGNVVIPSHDPFGNEIIITDAEINRLKEIDGFFESLAKNIDSENNSILDVLDNKQLFIKTRFWSQAMNWGLNGSPPLMSDIDMNNLGYSLELQGGSGFSKPNSIKVTGPQDSPYSDISTQFVNANGNNGFYSVIVRTGGLFKRGTYTLNIDGTIHTMDYSNIDARQNLLFVLPTLHTNAQGMLVSISLEYKLPDGTTIDPVNIVTDVMIQMNDDTGRQYFDTPWLRNENASVEGCDCVRGLFSYTLPTPLDISHLAKITIPYNDLLGNTYFTNWQK
jgi:hypothetical protein